MVRQTRSAANMSLAPRSPIKRFRPPRGQKAPARRKLFEDSLADLTCGPEVEESGPAPCAGPCEMERQDSACSTLTVMGEPLNSEGPATPEQSTYQRGAAAAPVWDEAVEAPLACALQAWRQQLVRLQPLVRLRDEVLLGALAMVRELAAARPDIAPTLLACPAHLYAFLAAALWMVSKLSGVRTQIPNRSLVSQATGVDAQALSAYEMDLLQSLDWDVAAVLRRQDLLCF